MKSIYQNGIKRLFSIVLSFGGLICLSWLFLIIVIAIKLDSPGPIFFKQKRIGIHKKHFDIYKFRTMRIDTPHDTPTHLLKNPEQYITRVGYFLRKTSLDELPQLYNILIGDMAVIGPRPALWNQYDLIAERDKYGANDVRPGLTGWAQIHGRDELEIEEKARFDGYYVKHMGLYLDVKCFLGTVRSVLSSDGVVEGGTGTIHADNNIGIDRQTENMHAEKRGKRKKIMVITNHSYMLWQFRRELIESLMKKSEVIISMPFVGHENDFKAMGIRCIETKLDRRGINPRTDLKLMSNYKHLLITEKPDMVITYSIKPNIYAGLMCSWLHIPYYANVQGLGTAFQKAGLAQFVTILYMLAFRNVRKVFFENEANAKEFQKRHIIPIGKQKILPGAGINLKYYLYQPYPHNEQVHFLYLGRIMKEKGIDELFAAVKRLHKENKKFVLDLVGFFEDEYKEQVEQLQRAGIAVFHGFQEDPRPFYAAADCVVLPSYHEGMSNVLLEAAATGRPVITSNIAGCREAVNHGESGILVAVKNSDKLYEAMKEMLNLSDSERREMGLAGHQKMKMEFCKDAVVSETIRTLGL